MKILVAPDKFKGSLASSEAAAAMERGIRRVLPGAEVRCLPVADGGEGTMEAMRVGAGGEWVFAPAHDALGRPIEARYLRARDAAGEALAVVEMAEASGLWRLAENERDPLRANTFGTGELLRHAAEGGARSVLVGLGGSATNDAGAGLACALGYRFLDRAGHAVPPEPIRLGEVERIDRSGAMPLPRVIAASDVRNPLLGPRGATRVYGPQKGVTERTAPLLETALGHFADICAREFGRDHREAQGSGAAGGLGFGLRTFCGAELASGFELLAELLGIAGAVDWADLVVTGEGKLDSQTGEGKAPAGLAGLARQAGKPVVAFAGKVESAELFDAAVEITPPGMDRTEAFAKAAGLLEAAVAGWFRAAPGRSG